VALIPLLPGSPGPGAREAVEGVLQRQTLLHSTEPWTIEAERLSYDRKNGVYEAEGKVRVYSAARSLQADRAILDSRNQRVELWGGVHIRYGEDWLKGDHAVWQMDQETGWMDGGMVFFARNHFFVQGKRIAKTGAHEYELDDGMVTTCDPALPDWSIHYRHMKVDTEGMGYSRHNAFQARDIPLIYTPWLAFPANTERHSGLLLPDMGGSSLNGMELEIPYYWAIRQDMDATFYGQYLQRRGFMGGAEYRIIHERWGEGIWFVNYLRDNAEKERLAEEGYPFIQRDRYWVRARHNFALTHEIEGKLDVDLVSDRNYLNEFELGSAAWESTNRSFDKFIGRGIINDPTITSRESVLTLNRRQESSNLNAELRTWENLDRDLDEFTLQQVPRVSFDVAASFLGASPFYYALASSWVDYWRAEWSRGQRLDLHPRLHYPFRWVPYLEFEPSVGVRASSYWVDWNDDPLADDNNPWQGRLLPDVRVECSSLLNRTFDWQWGPLGAFQHSVRPELTYEYVPDVDQSGLPAFDRLDSIAATHDVVYGFSTALTGKAVELDEQGEKRARYHEVARLRVVQALNIEKGSLQGLEDLRYDRLLSDWYGDSAAILPARRFSDISLQLDITPGRYVTVSYDNGISPYEGNITSNDLALTLDSTRGHTLVVDYRSRQDSVINELIAALSWQVSPTLAVRTLHDYSFDREEMFKQVYGITYQRGCWSLLVAYKKEADDQTVLVSINLLGLGQLGGGFFPFGGG
jgi:LPS-assembly protein